jgi:hypothetical protein
MSFEEAVAFWQMTGVPIANLNELHAGDVFILEDHRTDRRVERLVRIRCKLEHADGTANIEIEDAPPGSHAEFRVIAR